MTPERWQQIERVYHAAQQRSASERAAVLAELCAGDDALRREVESLLAEERSALGFLAAPAVELAADMMDRGGTNRPGSGIEEPGVDLIGRQVGVYQIQARLGAGGMGEVYRARDSKLGRDVAIKVLPPLFAADPERLRRLEREARMLAALNHPHIGAIYGFEQTDGVNGLVLELVEGPTLADRLVQAQPKGPGLPVDEALKITRQI